MRRLKLKLVLFSVVLMITATVNVHAEDWKGVDITNLSMTGDGYFESPISENALSDLKSRGVSVSGVGFTLVSVDLIKSDGTLRQNVFSGTYGAVSLLILTNQNSPMLKWGIIYVAPLPTR